MATSMASAAEVAYTAGGMAEGLRADGRGCEEFRTPDIELGVIQQATGSARFKMGGTDVLVAVKAEIGEPAETAPNCGRVNVEVELSACASPEFEGRGAEELRAELAATLLRSIQPGGAGNGALDFSALCIVPKRQCWVLNIDGLVLNYDGAVLDALSIAMRAALADTQIPSVKVLQESADAEPELEVNDEESAPLDLSMFPIYLTISKFGRHFAVDCTQAEELCAECALQVSVNKRGELMGASKLGPRGLDPGAMIKMVEVAQRLAPEIINNHDSLLLQEMMEEGSEEEA
mmetsp:Transcript_8559/g.15462  ORF Transcript_8559/g.15462 Transcript_8559/m.15462 type:complete len:291 (-) Transcript_8559:131-1003(-)|eukprot:CAMPEP_0177765640 /NCGR_PEP_ID=MMETSP0491_2-20121128/8098_1 /TAXON_ID=63592 /ORGANISM="Tetraselmis chuii, Strain PLY429" /LENGTH=290 /DNA_ID=CAMNT_0019281999 /DNA_START=106 /DNA_END=978 /DNA_ORIENTATION=-